MNIHDLSVVNDNDENLSEDRKEESVNNPLLPLSTHISDIEVMHTAKIKKFLSLTYVYGISQAYQIEEDGVPLKRVSILQCKLFDQIVDIRHTEEVIDGLLYEEYLPETISDVNLINQFLNETEKNQSSQTRHGRPPKVL